jgi:phospholipid N-methyltransferase
MESFLKEAIRSLKTSGTIKPSSKYLIDHCLRDIVFSTAHHIIEFGAGDGCITNEILSRMHPNAHLYSFELNSKFYQHCQKKFSGNPQISMLEKSALDFEQVLQENNIQQVDAIISSLPLTLFDEEHVEILLSKVQEHLKKGSYFIQYQYSLGQFFKLKKTFDSVNVQFTFRNVPPAFIYKCRNTK